MSNYLLLTNLEVRVKCLGALRAYTVGKTCAGVFFKKASKLTNLKPYSTYRQR
ncbi:hypothetical protein QUF90_01810 [Desulfococcaceae bacterium HSG9]|nr:hypothetical protein [Desulfococcaceae bacterium HSG9]